MSELPKFVKFDNAFPEAKITYYARARRLRLRVARDDGTIRLSAPQKADINQIIKFLIEQRDWIADQRSRAQPPLLITQVGELPIEGHLFRIVPVSSGPMRLDNETLLVTGNTATMGRKIKRFLCALAQDRLNQACDHYARQLGKDIARITLRDPRSRWGSCSSHGALMFSWRLILAPPEVLRYVAAHEVAHLAELNHSKAFWRLVDDLYGPSQTERQWLKAHGASLHRYRFD